MNHIVNQYAKDVVENKILTCKYEKLACQRHLNDLVKSESEDYPYTFDETRANRIIQWFTVCRHVRGSFSGEPIILEDWQCFDLGVVFGWVEKITGKRRFNTSYSRIARGQAKSTIMSGVAQYGMCADVMYPPYQPEEAKFEAMPEVVIGAVDRIQANIVWEDARQMGLYSPDISKRMILNKTKMSHKTRGGQVLKLSKDTKNKDGGSPCMIIIDEYHAHPTSLVKDVTSSGKGKRSQCLEFIITTAGEDSENSPCYIEDKIVKNILNGVVESENYFGMIRELDKGDDVHNEKLWIKANPFLRSDNEYSKNLFQEIKSQHDLAYNSQDHSKIRQWLIKRVNLFQASSKDKYFDGCMEYWKKSAITKEKFKELTENTPCYVGADLSKCIDLTAVGEVYPLDDGKFAVTAHGFIPAEGVQKHRYTDKVPYDRWGNDGWCTITNGAVTNNNDIKEYIRNLENEVLEFCYDPFGSRQLANDLDDEGYICVEIRQSFTVLTEATKKFRDLVMEGLIIHDGSPLLTWCISNAYQITNEGEMIRLSKKHKDDSQRIDLLAAIINCFVRAILDVSVNSSSDRKEVDYV